MVTYVCLGILFLFIMITTINYRFRVKRAPSPEQVNKLVLAILKSGQREHE